MSRKQPARKRVLLIDDDPMILAAYSRKLRANSFAVATADNGEDGLAEMQRFHPDVVLLDLDMPRLSGIDWLRKVRQSPVSRGLPVVILTAGRVGEQMKQAIASDASFVLSKNVMDPSTVVEAVAAAANPGGVRVYT